MLPERELARIERRFTECRRADQPEIASPVLPDSTRAYHGWPPLAIAVLLFSDRSKLNIQRQVDDAPWSSMPYPTAPTSEGLSSHTMRTSCI